MRVREYHAALSLVKRMALHHFGAADLNGLGAVFDAAGYAGLSGLKKRLVGPFPWFGGHCGAACNAGAGVAACAMPIFPVQNHSAGIAYSMARCAA